jgi:hypothetical protein
MQNQSGEITICKSCQGWGYKDSTDISCRECKGEGVFIRKGSDNIGLGAPSLIDFGARKKAQLIKILFISGLVIILLVGLVVALLLVINFM